ncbi:Na+/H+ antiporter NhaA [Rickettsia endosymbiont of Halotydeus destructor]|uniref:Na+/H+ antiporter NhaA n=1 Tax=Rickettsia endosymbiont of Halotydeus destructor TaxID=2996754 RepID=UPI003BB1A869
MSINNKLKELIQAGTFSGILLIITFALALVISNNSFLNEYYIAFIYSDIFLSIGSLSLQTTFIELINDGFMTFFFLLIGLEMKFHLVEGEYKNKKKLILPSAAALGGVVAPALIYVYFNYNQPTLKGWAIPIATDTAFVLGILSFFNRYTSLELRAFIIGFSLIDDAFALIILALFYTKTISVAALGASLGIIIILSLLNYYQVQKTFYYMAIGLLLWISMVEAGVHGTLCGAIIALFIPVNTEGGINISFKKLEELIRPFVNYFILPLFVFMNSGIVLKYFSFKSVCSSVTFGVIFGLFIGKQLGIMLFSYPFVRLKFCVLPQNTSWLKFYAIAILGGIGFTLSLFIGSMTFESGCPSNAMRIAVIIASLLSALFGILVLNYATKEVSN